VEKAVEIKEKIFQLSWARWYWTGNQTLDF